MKKSEIGAWGEELACDYLKGKGYKIIERNFKKPWGELDIIAKAKDKTIVFVEVKTLQKVGDLEPENQLTSSKLKKFKRVATFYIGQHQDLVNEKKGWRLDLIAVILSDPPIFRHYENIS